MGNVKHKSTHNSTIKVSFSTKMFGSVKNENQWCSQNLSMSSTEPRKLLPSIVRQLILTLS